MKVSAAQGRDKRAGFRNLAILAVLALLAGLVVTVLPNTAQAANDDDNDGYDTVTDCNDNNPLIHPNDANSYDIPDLGFTDTDCDGKDGNGTTAIKETTSQTDGGLQGDINTICADGSRTGNAKRQILLAGPKTYNNISIPSTCTGLVLAGGYNNTHTARTTGSNTVTFTGVGTGLSVDTATGVVLQLVTISGTTPSQSQGIRKYTFPTNNIDLVGTPTSSDDTQINYTTSTIQSVRWAGYVVWPTASGNTVAFTANTDDGTRLWVNGNLCVNSWKGQGATDYSCNVTGISANTLVPVQYDYMNNAGSGNAYLDWAYPTQSRTRIPAASFRFPEGESTYGLRAINGATVDLQRVSTSAQAGTAGMGGAGGVTGAQGIRRYTYAMGYLEGYSFDAYVSTTTDTQINTTSGGFGDKTAVRWIGYLIWPVTGTVTMHTNTDDGTRLWVGGSLIINDWTTSGTDNVTGTTASYTAGQAVPFVMDYFEKNGGDIAQLAWHYSGFSWTNFATNLVPAANFRLPEGDYAGNPNGQSLFLSRGDGLVGGIGGDGCGNCDGGRDAGGGGQGVAAVTGLSEGSPGTLRTGGAGGEGGHDNQNGFTGSNGTVSGSGGGNGGTGGAKGEYNGGCPDAGGGTGGGSGGLTNSVAGAAGTKGASTGQNTQTTSAYSAGSFDGSNGGVGGTGHGGGGGGGGGGYGGGLCISDDGGGGGGGGGGAGGGHSGGQGYAGGGSFGIWAHGGTVVADSASSASAAAGSAGGAGARGGTGGFGGRGGAGGRCDNGQENGGGGGGGGGGGYGGGGGGGGAGGPSYGVYGANAKVRIGFTPTNGTAGSGGAGGSAGMSGTPGAGSTSRGRAGGGCNAGGEGSQGTSPTDGTAGVAGDSGLSGATNGLSNAVRDLSVAVSGVPASMTAGQASSFTVTVTNNGGTASTTSPTVSIPLATGMAFDAGGSTAGCTGAGSPVTVTCTLTSITANGGTQAKTISVIPANVPYTTPTGPGPAGWQGFRATVGTDTGETHTFDNDSRAVGPTLATATQILKWADLTVTSATSSGNFRVGVDTTFTVNASNSGGKATASGSSLTITMPSGINYKTATGTGWTCPDHSSNPNAGPISCTRSAGDSVAALPTLTVTVQPRPQAVGTTSTTFATSVTEDLAAGNNSLGASRVTGHGVQGDMRAQITPTGGGTTQTYTVHFELTSFPSGGESDRLKMRILSGAPPGSGELYVNTQTYSSSTLDDNFVVNPTNTSQCSPATGSPGGVCYNFAGDNAAAPKIRAVTTNTFTMSGSVTVKLNVLPVFATSYTGSIQVKDGANPPGSATYWVYPMFNPSSTSFYTS